MCNELEEFKSIFNKIRNLGYVPSINNNNSGIGLTFEHLIGKQNDNFPFPDFKNTIEIKTKLAYSKTPIHLFKLTPDGNDFIESKRLLEQYGYYQNSKKEYKVFNGSVSSNKIQKIGSLFYFSLEVNYKEKKLRLLIYDKYSKLIDNSTYWDFDKLENAFSRKIKYLAIIYVWPTKKDGIQYYKYYRYDIYEYTNFYVFLHLLEIGIINVNFSIDIYKDVDRYGQMHDHGTSFDINKEHLNKLLNQIY